MPAATELPPPEHDEHGKPYWPVSLDAESGPEGRITLISVSLIPEDQAIDPHCRITSVRRLEVEP